MEHVSHDTLIEICLFLKIQDLRSLFQTGSKLRVRCLNESLWKSLVQRDFPLLDNSISYLVLKHPDIEFRMRILPFQEIYRVWSRPVYFIVLSSKRRRVVSAHSSIQSVKDHLSSLLWKRVTSVRDQKFNLEDYKSKDSVYNDYPEDFMRIFIKCNLNFVTVQEHILTNRGTMYDQYMKYVRQLKDLYIKHCVDKFVQTGILYETSNPYMFDKLSLYDAFQSDEIEETKDMLMKSRLYPIPVSSFPDS